MKLLTCVVPCYNSAAYMEHAVDSLLCGGEEMDVLIVDDGSADETGAIADRLAQEHPSIVRAHHQPNAGHGSAINYGVANALGVYFKVVDSDDRLIRENLPGLMEVLRQNAEKDTQVDLVFHDYVYDRADQQAAFTVTYSGKLPPDAALTWDDTKKFHLWNQFMIHSLIYRVQFLRDIHMVMPEHTFYEDNLYTYQPLAKTQRILYHHAPLYGYFTGRSDQSINEKNILKRLDQLTNIVKQQVTSYRLDEMNRLSPHLRTYLINNCCAQLFTTSALHFIENTERSHRMNRDLWQAIKDFDPALYKRLRRNLMARMTCMPSRFGEKTVIFFYRTGRKFLKF